MVEYGHILRVRLTGYTHGPEMACERGVKNAVRFYLFLLFVRAAGRRGVGMVEMGKAKIWSA